MEDRLVLHQNTYDHKEMTMYEKILEIEVSDAPQVPGLNFRRFRGEEDYPEMLAVYKTAMEHDGIEASDTLEELASNYQHLERCNPFTDMVFAEVDDELIAYGRCWWAAEINNDHLYSFFVNLRPDWRSSDVGLTMANWLINRLRTISKDHPKGAEKYLNAWAMDSQKYQIDILEILGLEPVRYNYMMTRPCSQPVEVHPLPDGIEVRPVTPNQLRKIWNAQAEAFRDHWGYVAPTDKDFQHWLEFPHFNPDLYKVAWDGGKVVGMVLNFINHDENREYHRKRGYTENISVRRHWRQQGVARALLTQSIQMFIEMGMEETALGVDVDNPNGALRLYESVGYTPYRTGFTYRKPFYTR